MQHRRRRLLGWGTVAMVAVTAACSAPGSTVASTASEGFPVTLHAANGTVHLATKPTAIVSLSPTATEMLYAIGAGRQVKAVDSDSNYPPGAPVTQLSGFAPNVEAILTYRPDLVVVAGDSTDLTGHLAAAGVPVLSLPAAADLSAAYTQIEALGVATGHQSGADSVVAAMRSGVEQAVASTHAPPNATYYYELDPTGYTAASSTFIGQLLALVGLHDIVAGDPDGGYPQLSAETVITANPTFIFLADTKCCGASPKSVAARPGWGGLAAVRDGRVVVLDDDIASRWGPRIVGLLRVVATAVDTSSGPASTSSR